MRNFQGQFANKGGRNTPKMGKVKNAQGTVMRVWNYMGYQKAALMFVIFLVVVTTLLGLLGPYFMGVIIDQYIVPKDLSGTARMCMLLIVIYGVTVLLTWLQTFVMINVALKTIQKIRQDIFEKIQTLSLRFFDVRSQGDLMSRVTNDIDNLNQALTQSVVQIISSALTFIGVTIAMFALNWILAIVTLITVPIMFYVTKKLVAYSGKNFAKRQKDLGELNGFIEEAITGADVTTLYGKEKETVQNFNKINEQLRVSATKADTFSAFIFPSMNFINNLGMGLVIGTGSVMVLNGMTTVGVIAAFINYSRQFSRPLSQFATLMNTIQAAVAGGERVFEIMDEVPEIQNKKDAFVVQNLQGHVALENVSFGYAENKTILKEVSLKAQPGETIALVGPTGSGKTTIINLLTRFYDIQQGQIHIDGKDIKDYDINSLRSKIGVVLQDTYLFAGSIMDNIRYGRLDASDEEVITAAKAASAHSFIKHLPNQYETEIASEGSNLSQGQKQLLAIARAILADADILILDEATSNIDTRTELQIQAGLNNLMRGRTSFVIAHRLKTIEKADQILVIKDGEILERGHHESLMEDRGFYFDLYTSQFKI
ncbi:MULTISPECIES: ABC transporter ATP-binding protein [Bacillus]|uniref:Multidrug ABC transporter ATP-binding protein n=3 Tax=Bacillus thuringiensis TaxID=1428 RepID=A0A1W6WNB1_BACTU|nr:MULTISPECIES: ABC transporter ATP-binding protein [Bacillus]MEC2875635.1 ABC transporter ATP-binding protein [Bacillus cereus]AEA16013.1 multidrug ABC transporter [Bacillus thuringiensis serovar chinensis CT-43]AFV18137.1 putative ABC transporter ATP-binding protein [Bacillus thuringiensis Bt407]AGG01081.1 Lipid A export ATP-binding/permease protein MsbA [Bacillus thuringiensis serovar thuringiensis str. IS5056]ARP57723.1 multidrug ABC transporter ATP-binding protein [Bacillus thuringiensis